MRVACVLSAAANDRCRVDRFYYILLRFRGHRSSQSAAAAESEADDDGRKRKQTRADILWDWTSDGELSGPSRLLWNALKSNNRREGEQRRNGIIKL